MRDHARNQVASAKLDAILPAVTTIVWIRFAGGYDQHAAESGPFGSVASARDFSCSLVTADNQLLTAAEGAPVHVLGSFSDSSDVRAA